VFSDKSLVATMGVSDLVIVETPDALLVADRGKAQDVGKLVARLKAAGRTEHESQIRHHRPWGYFETLNIGPRFQVKLLHVKRRQALHADAPPPLGALGGGARHCQGDGGQ
jgi:mannose-1-phosphate guanylyltransferase/mannose-6-phosphate isomerase